MAAPHATTSAGDRCFLTTRWSVIRAAQRLESPQARLALDELCGVYWRPLHDYIRRRGYNEDDAKDLTQEFFLRLSSPEFLSSVSCDKGKFRSFLLASLNHFLANDWHRAHAQKRGGHAEHLSLDTAVLDGPGAGEAAEAGAPAEIFDRRWAITILERALAALREEFAAAGKVAQFNALKPCLTEVSEDYEQVAAQLAMKPGAVAVAVHRLRKRYRELVRGEVAQTVESEAELESEMSYLLSVLGR
jgi:DNA-directed RNA polymerase specialized sigma24 family protein